VIDYVRIIKPTLIVYYGFSKKVIEWMGDDFTIDDYKPLYLEITNPDYLVRTGGVDSPSFPFTVVSLKTHVQFIKKCKGWI